MGGAAAICTRGGGLGADGGNFRGEVLWATDWCHQRIDPTDVRLRLDPGAPRRGRYAALRAGLRGDAALRGRTGGEDGSEGRNWAMANCELAADRVLRAGRRDVSAQ